MMTNTNSGVWVRLWEKHNLKLSEMPEKIYAKKSEIRLKSQLAHFIIIIIIDLAISWSARVAKS